MIKTWGWCSSCGQTYEIRSYSHPMLCPKCEDETHESAEEVMEEPENTLEVPGQESVEKEDVDEKIKE